MSDAELTKPTAFSVATWPFAQDAVTAATRRILQEQATATSTLQSSHWTGATQAVVQGIEMVEADPGVQTVGIYSFPNSQGVIQLDAAIIELSERGRSPESQTSATARFGSVMGLEGYPGSIRPAALVLEHCEHSYLVGSGAKTFLQQDQLRSLVPKEGQALPTYKDVPESCTETKETVPSHDTVGLIALDRTDPSNVKMTVGCSSSGMKEKHPGRVGDSPIFGSGLYGEVGVGGAVCTGDGDLMCTFPLAFLVVQKLKQRRESKSADEQAEKGNESVSSACQAAIQDFVSLPQVQSNPKILANIEIGVCAMDWEGNIGGASSTAWEGIFKYASASA